jgi:hypothetical protein
VALPAAESLPTVAVLRSGRHASPLARHRTPRDDHRSFTARLSGGHLDQIREDSLGQSKIISAGEIRPLAGKTQIGALCRPTRIGQPLSVVNDDSARRIEDFVSA